jgi:hypothetical protein
MEIASQRGRLMTIATEASTRSKALFMAACVLVRRTGLIESVIVPLTFWSVAREMRIGGRCADISSSVPSTRATWAIKDMSS